MKLPLTLHTKSGVDEHVLNYKTSLNICIIFKLTERCCPTIGKGEFKLILDGEKEAQYFNLPLPAHIQQPLIHSIVDELLRKGTCPSSGISGARANWVMGELVRSRVV